MNTTTRDETTAHATAHATAYSDDLFTNHNEGIVSTISFRPDLTPMDFVRELLHHIRTIEKDGVQYFFAHDVAKALGFKHPSQAIAKHCPDAAQSTTLHVISHAKKEPLKPVILITEQEVFKLVLLSQDTAAKLFHEWLTKELLPTMRTQGIYMEARPNEEEQSILDTVQMGTASALKRSHALLSKA